ncbi:MAG: prepilin peptidase [Methanobrevibacter sp.]|nr:prepilin peptidase [Methanobrevibacter sp.]
MDFTAIFLIQISVTLLFSTLAAIFDIKKNIIPNELNLFLLIFGIVSNLILSFLSDNVKYILGSIISMVVTYVVSYLLWKLNIWGGGDVKLFTSIATVIPFGININFLSIYPTISLYPFSFSVILNSILVSFPFLVIFISYLFIKNNVVDKHVDFLFNIFNIKSLKLLLDLNLNKLISIDDLKEGMIVNNYYFNNEDIIKLIDEIDGNLKVYKSREEDFKYYFKSRSAGGITNKELYLLKIMKAQSIIKNDISVKTSYPFAPSILCGLIIAIFCGDLMMIFTKNLVLVI